MRLDAVVVGAEERTGESMQLGREFDRRSQPLPVNHGQHQCVVTCHRTILDGNWCHTGRKPAEQPELMCESFSCQRVRRAFHVRDYPTGIVCQLERPLARRAVRADVNGADPPLWIRIRQEFLQKRRRSAS